MSFTGGFLKEANALKTELGAVAKGAKHYGKKAMQWVGKNPGKAALIAGGAGVAGNLAQGKGVRQSLTSSVLAPNYKEASAYIPFEKEAAGAASFGAKASKFGQKAMGWAKKNPHKAALMAGGAAAVGGTAANLAQGKGLRQSLTSSVLAPNYKEASAASYYGLNKMAAKGGGAQVGALYAAAKKGLGESAKHTVGDTLKLKGLKSFGQAADRAGGADKLFTSARGRQHLARALGQAAPSLAVGGAYGYAGKKILDKVNAKDQDQQGGYY
jgi:hypothetical protein